MKIKVTHYLCIVMKRRIFIYLVTFLTVLAPFTVGAQGYSAANMKSGSKTTDPNIFYMPDAYPAITLEGDTAICWQQGDTICCMWLRDFVKYSPTIFMSTKDQIAYSKLIRDVKKTLPYAKEIAAIILETYEYMETLPTDKERQKHLNKMEKYLMEQYTPKMKKLTRSQGQLLIKLVDRETNSSSYHIIDAFMGSFKAWSYNLFASLFSNSLKIRYNPYGEDRMTEQVCILVERGAV